MSAAASWDANQLLGMRLGTCVLEKTLGVGGMGAVYLARQQRPRRSVAVKVLRPQSTTESRLWSVFLARFRREADATAALDSAHIVPIYEFGEEGGIAYLVMPYLPDGSLATLLTREGPLALPRVVSYVEQIAAALDVAHARGIIHRDVKPSNLLLHPDGRLLLADFGIARPVDGDDLIAAGQNDHRLAADTSLTQAGSAMGTPEYMAPEQVRGLPSSAATDTYALGICAYCMLAGRNPFSGGDAEAVLTRQALEPPPPLRTIRPDIPKRVEEVIFWALAKDPADRPASTGAFASALREASQEHPLAATFNRLGALATSLNREPHNAPLGPLTPLPPELRSESGTLPLPPSYRLDAAALDREEAGDVSQATLRWRGGVGAPVDPLDATVYTPHPPNGLAQPATQPAQPWPAARPQPARDRRQGPLIALIGALALLVVIGSCAALNAATGGLPGILAAPTVTSRPQAAQQGAGQPTATATREPTATPTATPIPAGGLQLAPDAVQLGCKGGSRQATARLTNVGEVTVKWQASSPASNGVFVSPSSGDLDPGDSVQITLTNALPTNRQGTITFTPSADDDHNPGNPATLNFVSHC